HFRRAFLFFFSSRRRHTRFSRDWSSDVCSSDLTDTVLEGVEERERLGSTGFGRGVAIPHARIAGLKRPVAALIKLAEPIDFDARSEERRVGKVGSLRFWRDGDQKESQNTTIEQR